jgi:LacI family transcriptional regulator
MLFAIAQFFAYIALYENASILVLEAAAQFGFAADAAARRLRTQTSDLIAFVLSAPQAHFAHPFFLNMLMGIDERLED